MLLRQIFDPALSQYAYLIGCQKTGEALVIDPERDIDRYLKLAEDNDLRLTAVAETHIHADFVSGTQELVNAVPGIQVYLSGEGGEEWSYRWPKDGNIHLLKHGDTFKVGKIGIQALHTPGHTPEHLSYLITDEGAGADLPMALTTGDFLFVGDVGRPDLLETAAGQKGVMEGSARQLQAALAERLRDFGDYLQILPGHGAGSSCGKALGAVPFTTLGYERRFNGALKAASEDPAQFVGDILSGQPEPPLYFARMKRVNRDGVAVTGGITLPPRAGPREVATFIEAQAGKVLDLRVHREAFARRHLKHSLHAPFGGSLFLTAAGSYLEEEEPVLLVLTDDELLDEAVRQLYRIGIDRVVGWIDADDLELVKDQVTSLPREEFRHFDENAARANGVILDVRSRGEYEAGHIEGALSVPYTRLRARLSEVPRDRRVFVHCGTGRRAALAAAFLQSEGIDAVLVDGVCKICERLAREGKAGGARSAA